MMKWQTAEEIAVCPITELGFLRISTQAFNATMENARQSLSTWLAKRDPEFVPCDERVLAGLQAPSGGKTTDFYLAHLALAHGMKLATLDEEIAHSSVFVISKLQGIQALFLYGCRPRLHGMRRLFGLESLRYLEIGGFYPDAEFLALRAVLPSLECPRFDAIDQYGSIKSAVKAQLERVTG